VPAAGDDAAEDRSFGGVFIDVKRLRIELLRKVNDFFFGDGALSQWNHAAGNEIFKIPGELLWSSYGLLDDIIFIGFYLNFFTFFELSLSIDALLSRFSLCQAHGYSGTVFTIAAQTIFATLV
jgi:hypothetical protein